MTLRSILQNRTAACSAIRIVVDGTAVGMSGIEVADVESSTTIRPMRGDDGSLLARGAGTYCGFIPRDCVEEIMLYK